MGKEGGRGKIGQRIFHDSSNDRLVGFGVKAEAKGVQWMKGRTASLKSSKHATAKQREIADSLMVASQAPNIPPSPTPPRKCVDVMTEGELRMSG